MIPYHSSMFKVFQGATQQKHNMHPFLWAIVICSLKLCYSTCLCRVLLCGLLGEKNPLIMHSCCLNDTFQQPGDYRFIYRRGRAAQFLCWFYASVDYSDSLSLEPTWYFLKRLIFSAAFSDSTDVVWSISRWFDRRLTSKLKVPSSQADKNACNKQSHGSFYHHSWIKSQRYLKSFTWGSCFSSPHPLRMMLSIRFHWTVNSLVHWSGFQLQCDAAKMKISTFKSESMFPSKKTSVWWRVVKCSCFGWQRQYRMTVSF